MNESEVKKIVSAILSAVVSISAFADNIEEARQFVRDGDYAQARSLLEQEKAANPKAGTTALFNYLMGVCDFESGDYEGARRCLAAAKAKGYKASVLYLGRLAFLDYDFDTASEMYDEFARLQEKGGQSVMGDLDIAQRQLTAAENALGRVERIVVIDSIAVPYDDFFKSYRLPRSAGRLLSSREMPLESQQDGAEMAFMNEGEDFMIWGEPDSLGTVRLMESIRLTDGSWQEPVATPEILNQGGFADFPFMMPDGVTLYYSSDGEESMGGSDIFVVSRDPQTGEFLQPQNIGMPFNSPYDDYLLAIDEENGVGWWATDRNQLGDKLTIYVYKVNELRKNYNPDEEDIIAKARLTGYRNTQDPESVSEYEGLLSTIEAIDTDAVKKKADFYFPKKGGTYYTTLDDFSNPSAREAMGRYLEKSASFDKAGRQLTELRKQYHHSPSDALRQKISILEKETESMRREVDRLRSNVYKMEKGGN